MKTKLTRRIENIDPLLRVIQKLEDKYMTASDVMRILKISKMQLFYWDLKTRKPGSRMLDARYRQLSLHRKMWRRFSTIDLVWLTALTHLRALYVQINGCLKLVDWLQHCITDIKYDLLIYELSKGNQIIFSIGKEGVQYFLGSEIQKDCSGFCRIAYPKILVSLSSLFGFVLEKVKRDDFSVKFERDDFGGKNRITYYVNRERISLKEPTNHKL